jgi:hypothetical protein
MHGISRLLTRMTDLIGSPVLPPPPYGVRPGDTPRAPEQWSASWDTDDRVNPSVDADGLAADCRVAAAALTPQPIAQNGDRSCAFDAFT